MGQSQSTETTEQPVYTNDWIEYSCVNGIKYYMRYVNPKGYSLDAAAKYMIANETPKVGTLWKDEIVLDVKSNKVDQKSQQSLWIIIYTECKTCYEGDWIFQGSLADGSRIYYRSINKKGGNFRDTINKLIHCEKTPNLNETWKNGKVISRYCQHDGSCWGVRIMVK
jgi:hypothetical protein